MKNKLYTLLLLFSAVAGLGGCSSDDDGCVGIDCLPEATQTGAGTFGCLVNGEPFVDNSGDFNCFYQLVDGEYYFGIQAKDNVSDISQIFIGSNQRQIEINSIIDLSNDSPGDFYGGVNITNLGGTFRTANLSGTIEFTKFTLNQNIVSAKFEFTIINTNNNTIYEITEGRFDAQFNQ